MMRDPKGNELKLVLLQVMDKDEQGPVSLRVRRDHERIDLNDAKHPEFWMVWAPVDTALGEMRVGDMVDELENVKRDQRHMRIELAEQTNAIEQAQRMIRTLEGDNATKTEELRRLNRERDPQRVDRLVKAAIDSATEELREQLRLSQGVIVSKDREIEELRASKRKLKEANERLKERK